MTPLELIKQGILKDNLTLVQEGYKALTGETVTKNKITEAEPISEELVSQEEEVDELIEDPDNQFRRQIRSEQPQQTKELEDGTVQTEARREAVDLSRISFNMFEDDGETSSEYTDEDRKADEKSSKKQQVGRRKKAKKVTATCVDCQKTFKVLPIHQLEGSFTCGKCINKKRRR